MIGGSFAAVAVSCPLCAHAQAGLEQQGQGYALLRCVGCGFVYAWPRTIPSDLYDAAYSDQGEYAGYVKLAAAAEHPHLTWAMRRFLRHAPQRGHLLDIGCSTGVFLRGAQQHGWTVAGLEISAQAAAIARQVTGAPIMAGTIEDFASAQQFDAITAWEVIEHVADPLSFVQTALGHLKPGGVFALSVPNWHSPWMRKSPEQQHWPPYHLNFWERGSLRRLLMSAGLHGLRLAEKPFAWHEEVGRRKWLRLPLSVAESVLLDHKGMHLWALGQKI